MFKLQQLAVRKTNTLCYQKIKTPKKILYTTNIYEFITAENEFDTLWSRAKPSQKVLVPLIILFIETYVM